MADRDMVTIQDIDVPFLRAVLILVKWSIAAIPAMIMVIIFWSLLFIVLGFILALFGWEVPAQQ